LKLSPTDHPDYKNIEQALAIISQVALDINECKREAENMQLVQQISAKIGHKCEVSPTHSLSLSLSPLLTNILHPGFAYGTSTFCSRIRCSV